MQNNALIIGNGQLGSYIFKHWNNFNGIDVSVIDYPDIDIRDTMQIKLICKQYDTIINCAAYTDVDKAEQEEEKCREINTYAVKNLVDYAVRFNKKLILISTESVYGSNDMSYRPLAESSFKEPKNAYGRSKKDADDYAEQFLYTRNILILRPAWLFGPDNCHNFIEKIRRIMVSRDSIKVVDDQIGSLTSVELMFNIMKLFMNGKLPGDVYNVANTGFVSRYENSLYIKDVIKSECDIKPCSSLDYSRPVDVGKNSCLDCSKLEHYIDFQLPDWKTDVAKVLNKEM